MTVPLRILGLLGWLLLSVAFGQMTTLRPGLGEKGFEAGERALRMDVIVPYSNIVGADIPLSVAVFKGTERVVGAEVQVEVGSGQGESFGRFQADDSGKREGRDLRANDGVYSSLLREIPPGFHIAAATVRLPDGRKFTSFEFFEVFDRTGRFDGNWSEHAEDIQGDGFIDRVVLEFGVEIERAGDYTLEALLRAGNGKEIWSRNGAAYLGVSSRSIRSEFSAERMQELGADGPYEVVEARLLWAPGTGVSPRGHIASELSDVGETRAYDLDMLERPYFVFSRFLGDEGVDTNGNGRFDLIRVRAEFESVIDGEHPFVWHARLVPEEAPVPEGLPVGLVFGETTIVPGLNTIALDLPVDLYSSRGISGRFTVTGVSVHPARKLPSPYGEASGDYFQVPYTLGSTRSYAADELEGGQDH